jgi:hypothetical protein
MDSVGSIVPTGGKKRESRERKAPLALLLLRGALKLIVLHPSLKKFYRDQDWLSSDESMWGKRYNSLNPQVQGMPAIHSSRVWEETASPHGDLCLGDISSRKSDRKRHLPGECLFMSIGNGHDWLRV